MVMPLYDDAPLRHLKRPVVNHALIVVNIIVFLLVYSEILGDPLTIMRGFAIIPRVLFGEANLADWIVGPPAPATLVTSLFFHSSLLHIASNMLFLYVFGDNVEDAMGSLHYLLFYLSCGVMAGVFYIYATPITSPRFPCINPVATVIAFFLSAGRRTRSFSPHRWRRRASARIVPLFKMRLSPCRRARGAARAVVANSIKILNAAAPEAPPCVAPQAPQR